MESGTCSLTPPVVLHTCLRASEEDVLFLKQTTEKNERNYLNVEIRTNKQHVSKRKWILPAASSELETPKKTQLSAEELRVYILEQIKVTSG